MKSKNENQKSKLHKTCLKTLVLDGNPILHLRNERTLRLNIKISQNQQMSPKSHLEAQQISHELQELEAKNLEQKCNFERELAD